MLQLLQTTLGECLAASPHPVEREIALLLGGDFGTSEAGAFRLQRYHRKVDVARKLMAAYDDLIDKATSVLTVSREGYLGLAMVFIGAARREWGDDEASRANMLRWVNSAFNCLDLARPLGDDPALGEIEVELLALLRRGSAT